MLLSDSTSGPFTEGRREQRDSGLIGDDTRRSEEQGVERLQASDPTYRNPVRETLPHLEAKPGNYLARLPSPPAKDPKLWIPFVERGVPPIR